MRIRGSSWLLVGSVVRFVVRIIVSDNYIQDKNCRLKDVYVLGAFSEGLTPSSGKPKSKLELLTN